MRNLYFDYFYFHFVNWPTPKDRNGCYLCYKVERTQNGSPLSFHTGVFENEFYPRKPVHTEICFLNWFKTQKAFLAKNLSRDEKYHITWFMSWSPCFDCARRVVEFLSKHRHVELSIVAARLYFSNKPQYQQGLRSLQSAGAHVAIMSQDDFFNCWNTFVDHQGLPFCPWNNLDRNSQKLSEKLMDILQNQEN